MKDDHELERSVGRESDAAFADRCRLLVQGLPDSLKLKTFELLDSLTAIAPSLPRSLTFVPIAHDARDSSMEGNMAAELESLLERSLEADTFLACGELYGVPLTRRGIASGRTHVLHELNALGYATLSDVAIHAVSNLPSAVVESILTFIGRHPEVGSAGTESEPGAALVTVLDQSPEVVSRHADTAYMNETFYRLGIEARTRYSLERAAVLAKGRPTVFLQGAMHVHGVEGWAARRGVSLTVSWPPSLDPGNRPSARVGEADQ